jgi:energy-coupling factor transport system substrate-specific component
VIRLRPRSALLLLFTSVVGIAAFTWPLSAAPSGPADAAHGADAPWLLAVLVPLLIAILLAELTEGVLDAKAIAVLGVLVAAGAALRVPGMGATGFTALFFLLVPGGRVFGRGFGFVQGALTLLASALLTGGVGPWLPYQMLAAAWVGFLAGCLPPLSGRRELVLLAAYGAFAGLAYGVVMDMWFWPFATEGTRLGFVAGAPVSENLGRFWTFHLTTALGFDIPRAVATATLVLFAGGPVLGALRRAARRAAFVPAAACAPESFTPETSDPVPARAPR